MRSSALRARVRERIDPMVLVVGRPLSRYSVCQVCGLDSGPWLTRRAAELSSLLHLHAHHMRIEVS